MAPTSSAMESDSSGNEIGHGDDAEDPDSDFEDLGNDTTKDLESGVNAKDLDSDFEDLGDDTKDLDVEQEGETPAALTSTVLNSDAESDDSNDGSNDTLVYGAVDDETIEQAGQQLFPVASMWSTKEKLKESLTKYGLAFGFSVSSRGWTFECNKAGFTKDRRQKTVPGEVSEDKKTRNGSCCLKGGCEMCVKYTLAGKDSNGKHDHKGAVRLTQMHFTHTSTCKPSPNQLIVARKKSGDYAKLPEVFMVSILKMMENDPGVPTRAL
jgi:hypothetical protein